MFKFDAAFYMRRAVDCVEGVSFRASRVGARRCSQGLGAGLWVFKVDVAF